MPYGLFAYHATYGLMQPHQRLALSRPTNQINNLNPQYPKTKTPSISTTQEQPIFSHRNISLAMELWHQCRAIKILKYSSTRPWKLQLPPKTSYEAIKQKKGETSCGLMSRTWGAIKRAINLTEKFRNERFYCMWRESHPLPSYSWHRWRWIAGSRKKLNYTRHHEQGLCTWPVLTARSGSTIIEEVASETFFTRPVPDAQTLDLMNPPLGGGPV